MSTKEISEERRIACAGTYPPRQCGIATFTQDLCRAMLCIHGAKRLTVGEFLFDSSDDFYLCSWVSVRVRRTAHALLPLDDVARIEWCVACEFQRQTL